MAALLLAQGSTGYTTNRAVTFNNTYRQIFNEYKKLLDSIETGDRKNTANNTERLSALYLEVYDRIGIIGDDPMPVSDMFDKISLPFKKSDDTLSIYVGASGIAIYPNNYIGKEIYFDDEPIESLTHQTRVYCISKCYTFYSALNPRWRDRRLDMDYMSIYIEHNNSWFPANMYETYDSNLQVAIHSPNVLPDLIRGEHFALLEPRHHHLITYSEINTHLLPPDYDTNCRDYYRHDLTSDAPIRSDCISRCLISAMQNDCEINCVPQTDALLRRELFDGTGAYYETAGRHYCPRLFNNYTIDNCLATNMLMNKWICNDECRPDCQFRYFDWDLKIEKPTRWTSDTTITIKHNIMPDQLVRHYPETTFTGFVSNFGGLLGMWLGMSALGTFDMVYCQHPAYETLSVTTPAPHVLHVQLNRPSKRNAVSRIMFAEIGDCFARIDTDKRCRAVVLSGAGQCFSAGLDFYDMSAIVSAGSVDGPIAADATATGDTIPTDVARRGAIIRRVALLWGGSLNKIAECSKPVVAAIHGPCIGAGLEVALVADVRHCSADAYFSIREVRIGMAADMGSLQRVPKLMGNRSLARELAFTGRDMPAAEALAQGLVSAVTEGTGAEQVLESALAVAKQIAANSPVAVQGTKAAMNYSDEHSIGDGLEWMAVWNQAMIQSEDLVTAATATATRAKEPPQFSDF
ncbi:unnamed protein product [Medioppia subpectinata]|uniref:Enoyl-CoA hydratase n=1 Tax=Medioppia subpectinata TaxID=1979941 RepID=A0A7R9KKY2_9ACAR|nr:unnamed protein product [Medioppia subpectinata]CAG2105149.1 unnamed protein product [Medioppia subpectinata]